MRTARLTLEDQAILITRMITRIESAYLAADRIDAKIMTTAQQHPAVELLATFNAYVCVRGQ